MTKEVKICDLKEIPEDNVYSFTIEGKKIMLRKINGSVYATSAICTHRAVDLTEKGIFSDEYVTCKNHVAVFDITTGEVIQPPATVPLDVYSVTIRKGEVYIQIE